MTIHYEDSRVALHHGDCLAVMADLPDNSVDSICTDPPYGLGFMGKAWDDLPPGEDWARECLRVLKPGGHLLAFGGTRTWHRLACAVEDAGFEVRDSIAWLYGSGFPKSLDVSKAIDKQRTEDRGPRAVVTSWVGAECARLGWSRRRLCEAWGVTNQPIQSWTETNPAYAVVPTWENWQRLKALVGFGDDMDAEVWRLNGRKGTPGAAWDSREVLGHVDDRRGDGTVIGLGHSGELNRATSDAAREWAGWGTALKPAFEPVVVARKPLTGTVAGNVQAWGTGALNIDGCRIEGQTQPRKGGDLSNRVTALDGGDRIRTDYEGTGGRWPANVILDEDQAAALDEQSGNVKTGAVKPYTRAAESDPMFRVGEALTFSQPASEGGASRFFYVAKAPKRERPVVDGVAHPTVKPLALMRWLVRLVTPPGGVVLEPFAGSGTTVEACLLEGFQCIAIEKGDEYLPLIVERIARQDRARIEAEVVRQPDPEAAIEAQFVELGLFDIEEPA